MGRATAHFFAANGAKAVYICDYVDQHLSEHEAEIKRLYPGVDVHARKFDAADEEGVKEVISKAIKRYGHLDGESFHVFNVGIGVIVIVVAGSRSQ